VDDQVQLLTGEILNLLVRRLPEDAFALLGVTLIGLYPEPSWDFVFGQVSPGDRVGIYSFVRYDPRFKVRNHRWPPQSDAPKELQGPSPRDGSPVRHRPLHLVPLPDERIEPPRRV
jgi:hypothetical protein